MSAVIRLNNADLQAVFNVLDDVQQALVDMRPAWVKLKDRWQDRAREQWRSNQWPALAPRYAKQVGRTRATLDTSVGRAPKGLTHPPGALKRAVTGPEVFDTTRDSLVMGVRFGVGRTPAYYGAFHQKGAGVPLRPVWKRLGATERREWMQVVTDQILEPLR